MKILIGCEESQIVCNEFRKMGLTAFSCDIMETSGTNKNWHIKDDLIKVIKNDNWNCLIAFPPCTHLAVSGAAWFKEKIQDGRQQNAINFFLSVVNSNIKHICVENPVGIMSSNYRKPDQIIQPFYFGDNVKKTTCLWLKNLPKLYHNKQINLFDNNITHVPYFFKEYQAKNGKTKKYSGNAAIWFRDATERSKQRSKTFNGIAVAMAKQWGNYLIEKYKL